MKKKITILIAALAISVGFNLYFFGWKALERKARKDYLRGSSDTIAMIIKEAEQKKQVVINTQNGQLVLVVRPKPQVPEKKVEVK